MGLFSRRRGPSAKANTDAEARAVAAVALACAFADGNADKTEIEEIFTAAEQLPVFRKFGVKPLQKMLKQTVDELLKRGVGPVLLDATAVMPPELRETAFFVASRVAGADGVLDDREQDFLTALAGLMDIPGEKAARLFADAIMPSERSESSAAKTSPQPTKATPEAAKRSETSRFDAYVLLSEPLTFTTDEIRTALCEDYPALQIENAPPVVGEMACDTAAFVTAPMIMGQAGEDACLTTLIRLPGYGTWDVAALSERQMRRVPDIDQRMARNASYICISVSAKSNSLTDAFRAARLSSCIAAVFARLPVALAVYWEGADHFLTPEQVISMADEAMDDTWPCMSWLSLDLQSGPAGDAVLSQVTSRGLASFVDYELVHTFAPVPAKEAATTIMSASWMVLQAGHSFCDGDTLGHEGKSKETAYKIRRIPKTVFGSPTDLVAMVHPNSAFDAEKVLGSPISRPAPQGVRAEARAQPGFFKRMMSGASRLN